MRSVFRIGVDLRSAAATASIVFLYLFLHPAICEAVDVDLEKSMNKSLAAARAIVDTMAAKLAQGVSVEAELSRLRKTAEDIKTNSQLLEERFKQREEKANVATGKKLRLVTLPTDFGEKILGVRPQSDKLYYLKYSKDESNIRLYVVDLVGLKIIKEITVPNLFFMVFFEE